MGEGIDAGEIQGVVLIRQGRIMMLQQEGPAFFIQQAAADGHQLDRFAGAPHIETLTMDSLPVPSSPVTMTGALL